MKGWRWTTTLGLLALATMGGTARAEYSRPDPPAAPDGGAEEGEDQFNRAVDLRRFRKGNYAWDTQELIASGFTALHRENREILRELEEIKSRITRLEGKD